MKLKKIIMLFCAVLLFGCKSDDVDMDSITMPRVLFMVEQLKVDLNAASLPEIVSVIQSEAGLKKVNWYIIKTGDSETMYETPVTSFPNPNSYSSSKLIPYTEDVIGFRVEAIDKYNRIVSEILPIKVTPFLDAPQVTFFADNVEVTEITYKEGQTMPIIKIKAISEELLLNLVMSKVVDRTESIIPVNGKDTVKFVGNEKEYTIDLSVDSYVFESKTSALKLFVTAGDAARPKIKLGTLKVNYVEIPKPIIQFADGVSKQINEFSNYTVTGNITAQGNIKNVKYYREKVSGNTLLKEENLSPSVASHGFSIPIASIKMDDKGLVVMATDDNDKTTTSRLAFDVIEQAPAPTITVNQTEEAFNGVNDGQNIFFSGTISTLSDFASVSFVVFDNNDTETHRSPLAFTGKSITLSAANAGYTTTKTTRRIGIEVTDLNGKETKLYRDVHVGYYFAKVLMSLAGEDSKTSSITGPLPGPFFSAKNRVAMSYITGKAAPMDCDISFHAQATYGAIRCGSMTYAKASSKYTGHTKTDAGLDTWSAVTNYIIRTNTGISRANFEKTTIDDFASLTPSGTSESPVMASGSFPNAVANDVVVYYQSTIGGETKNVILTYDNFETLTADKSASTFYIKVKIQK